MRQQPRAVAFVDNDEGGSEEQLKLIEILETGGAIIIPMTCARSLEGPGEMPRWAITHSGMQVLEAGRPDPTWDAEVANRLATLQEEFKWAEGMLVRICESHGATIYREEIGGLTHMVRAAWPTSILQHENTKIQDVAWIIHDQCEEQQVTSTEDPYGIQVIPRWGKLDAAKWLHQQLPGAPLMLHLSGHRMDVIQSNELQFNHFPPCFNPYPSN